MAEQEADAAKVFSDVLDFADFDAAKVWIGGTLGRIQAAEPAELLASPLLAMAAPSTDASSPLGPYASPAWRRFALAIFVADWACYARSADRADFPRLLSVVATFPTGFRVWFCRLKDGMHVPVGYTGWYPISRDVFNVLYANPAAITHRGFMGALHATDPAGSYLYLFNYSIVPQLRRTEHSATLMRSMAADLRNIKALGLAAVTVSEDGARIARRFGLERRGEMYFEGEAEQVYASRAAGKAA